MPFKTEVGLEDTDLRAGQTLDGGTEQLGTGGVVREGDLDNVGGLDDVGAIDAGSRSELPDLRAGSCTDDGEFPAEPCVLPERRRNSHAPLLVRYLVGGSREEDADVVTSLLVGDGSLPHLLVNTAEFRLTEDVDAAFLAPCENQSASKFLTELGGKDDSTFFVQTRRMCAEKHGPPPVCS